mmetsp:Transcript_31323/g.86093  ORF Transcript_31323/g.86093 Transcript_31323/m.86093 type:complete len:585 (+) Transcript_31323:51-1805(+)
MTCAAPGSGHVMTVRLLVAASMALRLRMPSAVTACEDNASCQALTESIFTKLAATEQAFDTRQSAVEAIGNIRSKIMSGKRLEVTSVQRQHLVAESSLINEVTHETNHRAVSTNLSHHFKLLQTILFESKVRFVEFVLFRPPQNSAAPTPDAVILTLDARARLFVHSLEGAALIDNFDLGHGPERNVTHVVLSPSVEKRFILSFDEQGLIRKHQLQVTATLERIPGPSAAGDASQPPKLRRVLAASLNFSSGFWFSPGPSASEQAWTITAVLAVDRGIVVGDASGYIAGLSYRDGTAKAYVKVTEDLGGVRGLLLAEGTQVLFYSSHHFGFFNTVAMELRQRPCDGWRSPLFSVAVDPTSRYNQVVLALSDGDVLVYSSPGRAARGCELLRKFPRVSTLPFQLRLFQGYAVGLSTAPDSKDGRLREVFFFNLEAASEGYGDSPSRVVTVQVGFKRQFPESFALLPTLQHGMVRSGGRFALAFSGRENAIELYKVSVAMLRAGKAQLPHAPGWWYLPVGLLVGLLLVLVGARKLRRRCSKWEGGSRVASGAEGKEQDGSKGEEIPGNESSDDGPKRFVRPAARKS